MHRHHQHDLVCSTNKAFNHSLPVDQATRGISIHLEQGAIPAQANQEATRQELKTAHTLTGYCCGQCSMNQELTRGTSQARRVRPLRWLKGAGAHSRATPANKPQQQSTVSRHNIKQRPQHC
jgi:hypothetical protein